MGEIDLTPPGFLDRLVDEDVERRELREVVDLT